MEGPHACMYGITRMDDFHRVHENSEAIALPITSYGATNTAR